MIAIAAYWETFIGVNEPIYLKDIWKDTVKPLYATHLFLIDEEGLKPDIGDKEITYETFPSLEKIIKRYPKATFVLLEAERNIPKNTKFEYLKNFKHPKRDVIYVVGKDSDMLPVEKIKTKKKKIVCIKTFDNFSLWSLVVAGIALYDRRVKEEK